MKIKKTSGIYLITSKHNGNKYVGQSVNIGRRWNEHLSDLRLNKHGAKYLQNHFNKYGIEDLSFEVLEEVIDLQKLTEREQYWMDTLNPEFNYKHAAGSVLGLKREGAKYYCYHKIRKVYRTYYKVNGKSLDFNFYYLEQDAINNVEYIKSLTDTELLLYHKECISRVAKRPTTAKNYYFDKNKNRWTACININGKYISASFKTEQEAKDKVQQLRLENNIANLYERN